MNIPKDLEEPAIIDGFLVIPRSWGNRYDLAEEYPSFAGIANNKLFLRKCKLLINMWEFNVDYIECDLSDVKIASKLDNVKLINCTLSDCILEIPRINSTIVVHGMEW